MPEVFRRIVLKPPGLSADASAQLLQRLEASLDAQRQLSAGSPHILQFVGGLEEDEKSFYVEHEPARSFDAGSPFDPDKPPADDTLLLHVAAALADALRVAHGAESRKSLAHGGLCPGVILETPDGIHKIADFGFAPAICAALGVDSYVELAVATGGGELTQVVGTGIWEVLSPDEATRDDRLCGFIDPEKYGSRVLGTFEAGSDVIAVGILLHLLAEHRHPMLEDPDAHRMVVLAESMAFWPYNGARRQSLRESSDPAIRCWCDMVARMLARLPVDRPSAGEIAATFAKAGVKPVDAGEMLRRRLEAVPALIENRQWDKARRELTEITSGEALPVDVADKADSMLEVVQAHVLLAEAKSRLDSDVWTTARESLDRLLSLSSMPPEVAEQADRVAAKLQHNLEIQEDLDRTEAGIGESDAADPGRAFDQTCAAVDRTGRWLDDDTLLSPLRSRCEQARDRLQLEHERLKLAVEEREAELALVKKWFEGLKSAWEQEQWGDFEQHLRSRPDTPHWPDAVKKETKALEVQFVELQKAGPWIEALREALDSWQLDNADRLAAKKPALAPWPATLGKEVGELEDRLRLAKAIAADHARAREWIKRLESAVGNEDWTAAARELTARPPLEHWPDNIVEQVQLYQSKVDQQIAELERKRLEIEEANRTATTWLERAEEAARRESWQEATTILEAPPLDTARMPEDARLTAEERIRAYHKALEDARRKQQERATQAAQELASTFVWSLIESDLSGFVAPQITSAKVGPIDWESVEAPTAGHARLELVVADPTGTTSKVVASCEFGFRLDEEPPRLCDDDGAVRQTLCDALTKVIRDRQVSRAPELVKPWQAGLFPKAEMTVKLDGPVRETSAALHLLGKADRSVQVEVALAWNSNTLTWAYADPAGVSGYAVDLVHRQAQSLVPSKVLDVAVNLERHASHLTVEVDPPPRFDPTNVPASLTLPCRLTIDAPGEQERQTLLDFSVVCPKVGEVVIVDSLAQAGTRMNGILVARQNQRYSDLHRDLKVQAKAAPAKVKLVALTRKIKEPVDEVRFELRPKRRDRLTLTARWNPDSFDFEFQYDLHTKLEGVLGEGPPAPARPSRPRVAAEADKREKGSKAEGPLRKIPAKAFALTAVAVVFVLAVSIPIIQSIRSGRNETSTGVGDTERVVLDDRTGDVVPNDNAGPVIDSRPPETEDDGQQDPDGREPDEPGREGETAPGGGEEQPGSTTEPGETPVTDEGSEDGRSPGSGEQEPPATDLRPSSEAVAAVGTILSQSPHLVAHIETLITEEDSPQQDLLIVKCLLPGLAEPRRSLTLRLNPQDSPLSAEDSSALEGAVGAVETLLNESAATFTRSMQQDLSAALVNDPFINADRIRVRVEPGTEWGLNAGRTAWLSTGVGIDAVYNPGEPPDETPVARDSESIDLARMTTDLVAANGAIGAAESEVAGVLAARIRETLLERQSQSLNDHWRQATRDVADSGARVDSEVETLSSPASQVVLTLHRSRLIPRRVEFQWDRDRLLFASDPRQDVVDGLSRAANLLDAIDQAVTRQNHWLRPAWPDRAIPPLQEIGEPQPEGTWTLGLAPPWQASGEGDGLLLPLQADISGDEPTLARPDYWPVIERYAELMRGPLYLDDPEGLRALSRDLTEAVADTAGAGLTPLTDYLGSESPPQRVIPRVELLDDTMPVLNGLDVEAFARAETQEPSLRLAVRVEFGVKPALLPEEELLSPIGAELIAGLNVALEDLTAAKQDAVPRCLLELTIDNTDPLRVVERWTDAGAVASGLLFTLAEARQLERTLRILPAREAVEQTLEQELGGLDQVSIDLDRAYALLQDIWLVKGSAAAAARRGQHLAQFSEDRQRQLKRSFSRPKRRVEPSVLIEFFSGPRWTFAVAWSVKRRGVSFPGETVQEGPFLIRVCSTEQFYGASSSELTDQLGGVLFDKVMDLVPEAVAAENAGTFGKHLGVAVAHDDRLSLADLPELTFQSRRSFLEAVDLNTQLDDSDVEWASLAALREGDWACDYVLVRTLSDARGSFVQLRGARAWAVTALDQAIRSAQAAAP